MKKCTNCGTQNDDNSLFCSECGRPLPQNNVCSHCGAQVNEGDAFCQNCGKSLTYDSVSSQAEERPHNLVNETNEDNYEEEENSFKKYQSYIIGLLLIIFVGGGCFWYYSSNSVNKFTTTNNDSITIVDSAVVDSDFVATVDNDCLSVDSVDSSDENFDNSNEEKNTTETIIIFTPKYDGEDEECRRILKEAETELNTIADEITRVTKSVTTKSDIPAAYKALDELYSKGVNCYDEAIDNLISIGQDEVVEDMKERREYWHDDNQTCKRVIIRKLNMK